MASIINASTSSGIVQTADTSGVLQLQTASTTAVTLDTSQNATFAGKVTSAGALTLASNGSTTAVTIDTSQNVGIGTTSPSTYGSATRKVLSLNNTDNVLTLGSYYQLGIAQYSFINSSNAVGTGNIDLVFSTGSNTERMRIDSSGNLLVGQSSQFGSEAFGITRSANTATYIHMLKATQVECTWGFKSSTDSNMYIGSGSSAVGTYGVYLTNTGNSWNAVSDERQKNIIEPIENGLQKVNTLRAIIGSYKNDPKELRRPFLIAQDVQAVLPEAVNVQDEETGTLGMSYTDVIPLLVAAIQEQTIIINDLKARITALEGAK